MSNSKKHFIFWPVLIVGLSLDLWSKWAVFSWLGGRRPDTFPVIDGFFQLVRAVNDGAAFGIASGQRYFLMVVSIAALAVVLGLFLFADFKHRLNYIALGLFSAGICGNLYDRIFNEGRVRDFIDIVYWPGKHWPAFNIADSMLCVGVGIMVVVTVWGERRSCS